VIELALSPLFGGGDQPLIKVTSIPTTPPSSAQTNYAAAKMIPANCGRGAITFSMGFCIRDPANRLIKSDNFANNALNSTSLLN
jgi:hypothetical protein